MTYGLDSSHLLGREDGIVGRRNAAGFYFLSRAEGWEDDGRREPKEINPENRTEGEERWISRMTGGPACLHTISWGVLLIFLSDDTAQCLTLH